MRTRDIERTIRKALKNHIKAGNFVVSGDNDSYNNSSEKVGCPLQVVTGDQGEYATEAQQLFGVTEGWTNAFITGVDGGSWKHVKEEYTYAKKGGYLDEGQVKTRAPVRKAFDFGKALRKEFKLPKVTVDSIATEDR